MALPTTALAQVRSDCPYTSISTVNTFSVITARW
jgi:hypothetical protein